MKLSREWHQAHRRELNAEIHEKCRAACADVRRIMKLRAKNQAFLVDVPPVKSVIPPDFRAWRQSLKANRLQHQRKAGKK